MSVKKPKFLTLKDKAEILEQLRSGCSVTGLSKKYGVAKSTICGINKNKNAILKCVNNTFCGPGKRKTLRLPKLPKMEKSLYRWFIHMRDKSLPVSGLMLKEKAKELHSKIREHPSDFNASDGWLQKFRKRYSVRLLKVSGEKRLPLPQLADSFKLKLNAKMKELGLCNDQLYSADESGLFWKLLPDKTYVSSLGKSAEGIKMEKQRFTFLCCANASGAHKLKLLLIGKSKNPRCFENCNFPVHYTSSKAASMTSAIFKEWFHNSFVSEVKDFLMKKELPMKAILLIDNAQSHPPEIELRTDDGSIIAMFMPPNVTALIQNAIRTTKLHYRNSLLESIAAKGLCGLIDSMKQLTLKEAITFLESAWSRVNVNTLGKCWNTILNMVAEQDDPEDDVPLSILKENWEVEINYLEESVVDIINILTPQIECTVLNVREWNVDRNEDVIVDYDENEMQQLSDNDDCLAEEQQTRIKAQEAVEIFDKALRWAEAEMICESDLKVLRSLKQTAILKCVERKTGQKQITELLA